MTNVHPTNPPYFSNRADGQKNTAPAKGKHTPETERRSARGTEDAGMERARTEAI